MRLKANRDKLVDILEQEIVWGRKSHEHKTTQKYSIRSYLNFGKGIGNAHTLSYELLKYNLVYMGESRKPVRMVRRVFTVKMKG